MSSATQEEIIESFRRSTKLCAGIGYNKMLEILKETVQWEDSSGKETGTPIDLNKAVRQYLMMPTHRQIELRKNIGYLHGWDWNKLELENNKEFFNWIKEIGKQQHLITLLDNDKKDFPSFYKESVPPYKEEEKQLNIFEFAKRVSMWTLQWKGLIDTEGVKSLIDPPYKEEVDKDQLK